MDSPATTLPEAEQLLLRTVRTHCPEFNAPTRHVRAFAVMLTERQGERLPDWLAAVRQDDLPTLPTLAAGIDRDRDAVIAGLALPWSSGAVEGHVNRIKMLKRQMFGRAGHQLLRKRVPRRPGPLDRPGPGRSGRLRTHRTPRHTYSARHYPPLTAALTAAVARGVDVHIVEYAATLGLIDIRHTAPAGARTDYHHQWGADHLDCLTRYGGLLAVRLNPLGVYATGAADTYLASACTQDAADVRRVKVLGNFDIVAPDGLTTADTLLLRAYAVQTADRVWQLSSGSLLAALGAGRTLRELRAFLTDRSDHVLPDTVSTLLADVEARSGRLTDRGPVHPIECTDRALSLLLAGDRRLRTLCTPLGELHLAVRPDDLPAFHKRVQDCGYVLPT